MARPKSADPRSEAIRIRVTRAEKARIGERAVASGQKVADYVRNRALGLRANGIPDGRAASDPLKGRATAADLEREAVAAEVAEAKMPDEEARDAFIRRRTRELFGQGKTGLLAARMATEEWNARGA